MKNTIKVLILILFVSSILRLWNLSQVPVSLFGDELDVGYHAFSFIETGKDYSGNYFPANFQSLAEWRTPLFIYSTIPTVALFGITPLGVRLPAAVFGILGVLGMYLFVREFMTHSINKDNPKVIEVTALLSALFLGISPWHIQYSRAAFEVTMLIMFYLFGLYFFFKSFVKVKYFSVSLALLIATPLIYSTAKLFTLILLILLFLIWRKEIIALFFFNKDKNITHYKLNKGVKKYIVASCAVVLIMGSITTYATLFSGGTQRFGYISVFSDPTREPEVGVKREQAARFRGEMGIGLTPTFSDKLFYNKYTFWGQRILKNYFESFSGEFLFIKGDFNLRHSIEGIGQFYKVEAIALILGLIYFFGNKKERKNKLLIALWLVLGVIPSAITREGGRHATRLIVILPPMIFLISYGLVYFVTTLNRNTKIVFTSFYATLLTINFIFYQQNYWTQNPWYSERWWHAGYKEAIQSVKELESNYNEVLITMASEPAWTFFAAYMNYDPVRWQNVKPDSNWIDDPRYGRITMIDKYYFTSPQGQLYDWGKNLEKGVLVLSSEKEVGINLIKEPDRTPGDLTLIKSITYPSGLPAFYLFEKK
ncbi:hypothetical protein IPM62_04670 [Candidatus Woesebacteria bacterium]|nr:MAG: hypothetical protein IPM62_04670 [Candidatus Woesebacteria bacterium]